MSIVKPFVLVTGDKFAMASGSGYIQCNEPAMVFKGMSENPNNPPANQLNIDGTYHVATVDLVTLINGNTNNMTGAVLDSDGYYRFTGNGGGTTRYVWINEHGYTMAQNPNDGVLNLYDNNTAVNAGQGSRLGFVYNYSGVSTVISNSNTDCPTCEIVPRFYDLLFENL